MPSGHEIELRLPVNSSSGYTWRSTAPEFRDVAGLVVIPRTRLPGTDGTQLIRLRPTAAGKFTIDVSLGRFNQLPVQTISFEADVESPPQEDAPVGVDLSEFDIPKESSEASKIQLNNCVVDPATIPPAFDWRAYGKVTPVQDQQQCGSCWAFATTAVTESAVLIADWVSRNISEQYLVSCNTYLWGCGGGNEAHDFNLSTFGFQETAAGTVYESEFPYSTYPTMGTPPPACGNAHPHHERITQWYRLPNNPTNLCIKQSILRNGPVTADICGGVSDFQNYNGGVLNSTQACVLGITDHMITIVGWDDSQQAWILKNSWGTQWGSNGFARIHYGTLNIAGSVTYVKYDGAREQRTAVLMSTIK